MSLWVSPVETSKCWPHLVLFLSFVQIFLILSSLKTIPPIFVKKEKKIIIKESATVAILKDPQGLPCVQRFEFIFLILPKTNSFWLFSVHCLTSPHLCRYNRLCTKVQRPSAAKREAYLDVKISLLGVSYDVWHW